MFHFYFYTHVLNLNNCHVVHLSKRIMRGKFECLVVRNSRFINIFLIWTSMHWSDFEAFQFTRDRFNKPNNYTCIKTILIRLISTYVAIMFRQLVYEIVTGAGSPHARVYIRKQFITNDIIFFQMPCIKILMFVSNCIFVNMSYIYNIVYSICTR